MTLIEKTHLFLKDRPWIRNTSGGFLIVIGIIALVTPFTPGSWLALIGFEIIGFRHSFLDKIRDFLRIRR